MKKSKRSKKLTKMTSLLFTVREREELSKLMERKGMKMGETLRFALREALEREDHVGEKDSDNRQ